ncbi:MAG: L,D-transpeptidase family protein [Lachnospiraceae bacterium]|nr:L,D-transpeptidase family protein [Lachnospiraceae bacterium]
MNKLSKSSALVFGSVGALVLLLLTLYLVGVGHYKTRFLPGTAINGIRVGGETAEEARDTLQRAADAYVLILKGRDAAEAQIRGADLQLTYVDQGELEQIIEEQAQGTWILHVGKTENLEMQLTYALQEEVLENQLSAFSFLQPENMQAPVNAYVADDGTNYVVVPEQEGAWLEREPVKNAILHCIATGATLLDMDGAALYSVPQVRMDDPALQNHAAYMNQLATLSITYDFVDRSFTADRDEIRSWIAPDENNNCTLNSDLVAQWVYNMAYETDTFANSHLFTTHNGEQILLAPGGDYGWAMDQEATTEALLQALGQGYSGNLEPAYIFTALDRSSNDIGGTYVEVCLTEQKMYLYEDYNLKLVTPVITGGHTTGFDTPSGSVWAIDGKKYQMHFTLFDVEVEFWLPFNGDCGIHDADWRSPEEYVDPSYYLENGSHGCVNTPYDAMETVFETVEIGYPVIVYYSAEQPVGPEPTQEVAAG